MKAALMAFVIIFSAIAHANKVPCAYHSSVHMFDKTQSSAQNQALSAIRSSTKKNGQQ